MVGEENRAEARVEADQIAPEGPEPNRHQSHPRHHFPILRQTPVRPAALSTEPIHRIMIQEMLTHGT